MHKHFDLIPHPGRLVDAVTSTMSARISYARAAPGVLLVLLTGKLALNAEEQQPARREELELLAGALEACLAKEAHDACT